MKTHKQYEGLQTQLTNLGNALNEYKATIIYTFKYDIGNIIKAWKECVPSLANALPNKTKIYYVKVNRAHTATILAHINLALAESKQRNPANYHSLAVLSEKTGRLSSAMVGHNIGTNEAIDVYNEAIQVAVAAMRIALDGDSDFIYMHDAVYINNHEESEADVKYFYRHDTVYANHRKDNTL